MTESIEEFHRGFHSHIVGANTYLALSSYLRMNWKNLRTQHILGRVWEKALDVPASAPLSDAQAAHTHKTIHFSLEQRAFQCKG